MKTALVLLFAGLQYVASKLKSFLAWLIKPAPDSGFYGDEVGDYDPFA